MTSKERAELRAKANTVEAVFQVGKGGISDALIAQTADALRARELIKLKVLLEASPEPPKETARKIAAATQSEVVQVVGGSIVLFKENPELHQPKKAVKKTKVNTIPKPRIARDRKPPAQGAAHGGRKSASVSAEKPGKAPAKHTEKKDTEHKPLHQGKPRSVTKPGKSYGRTGSDKKRG